MLAIYKVENGLNLVAVGKTLKECEDWIRETYCKTVLHFADGTTETIVGDYDKTCFEIKPVHLI